MPNKYIYIFLLITFGFLFFLFYKGKALKLTTYKSVNESGSFLILNNDKIFVEIADTPEKSARGLSGRGNLRENSGMLFTFSKQDQIPSFWMKGMLIPLDFIWINDDEVVQIDRNIQPEPGVSDRDLKIYKPNVPIDYVLEVNAGYCEKNGIKVGDNVSLTQI